MKSQVLGLLKCAVQIAKQNKARAIFAARELLDDASLVPSPPKGCHYIGLARESNGVGETEAQTPDNGSGNHRLTLPPLSFSRMSQIKVATLLALSQELIQTGDKIVFLTGPAGQAAPDSIVLLDTGRESEILTTTALGEITDSIHPEVFQEVLSLALELAAWGREGKPLGTIFVIGDEERVMQVSKQMIINPFKGYTEEECNILNPQMRQTIREFAALDGAFVISGTGLVLTAGRYLRATTDETGTPMRGLGARHIAAAGITSMTGAIAIVVSESTGTVRIFRGGKTILEIEKSLK